MYSVLIAFVLQEKVSTSSRLKYRSYYRGGHHRKIRRFHVSFHTVFVALQNFFSSEIAQDCSSIASDTISSHMQNNSTRKQTLYPVMQRSRSCSTIDRTQYSLNGFITQVSRFPALAEASRYFHSEAIAEAYVNQIDRKNRIT